MLKGAFLQGKANQLKKKPAPPREKLITAIRDLVTSPENYDTFIEQWQTLIASQSQADSGAAGAFLDIEAEAQLAIAAIAEAENHRFDAHQHLVPLQTLREPAFVVGAGGVIEDLNDIAWQTFGCDFSR